MAARGKSLPYTRDLPVAYSMVQYCLNVFTDDMFFCR